MLEIAVPLLLLLLIILLIIMTFFGNGDYSKLKKENERLENTVKKLADDINVRSRESRNNWIACQRINNQNIMLNRSNNELIDANQKLTIKNEKLYNDIQNIRLEVKARILEKDKQIQELKNQRDEYRDIISDRDSEIRNLNTLVYPVKNYSLNIENPYNNDLFQCHCGSTDFVDIEDHERKGVKNEPPFIECVVQCVKCGAFHTFKEEVDSVSISKSRIKKST